MGRYLPISRVPTGGPRDLDLSTLRSVTFAHRTRPTCLCGHENGQERDAGKHGIPRRALRNRRRAAVSATPSITAPMDELRSRRGSSSDSCFAVIQQPSRPSTALLLRNELSSARARWAAVATRPAAVPRQRCGAGSARHSQASAFSPEVFIDLEQSAGMDEARKPSARGSPLPVFDREAEAGRWSAATCAVSPPGPNICPGGRRAPVRRRRALIARGRPKRGAPPGSPSRAFPGAKGWLRGQRSSLRDRSRSSTSRARARRTRAGWACDRREIR
jgi:hypothetical protein